MSDCRVKVAWGFDEIASRIERSFPDLKKKGRSCCGGLGRAVWGMWLVYV